MDASTQTIESSFEKNLNCSYIDLVKQMKEKEAEYKKNQKELRKLIDKTNDLTQRCILLRKYSGEKSNIIEQLVKKDLRIIDKKNSTSGDGHKNNKNIEIKSSIHAKNSKLNYVQIRPDHDVHYYIFIAYNMYENDTIGKAYIFNIPSERLYDIVIKYGSYAHGNAKIHGTITRDNFKGKNLEYCLRFNPNVVKKKSKSFELWNEFKKYEVEYNHNNFI